MKSPLEELEAIADALFEVIGRLRAEERGDEQLYTEGDLQRIMGPRIGREQRKTAKAEERVAALEEELEELRESREERV